MGGRGIVLYCGGAWYCTVLWGRGQLPVAGREKSRCRFVTPEVQTHLATMIEVAATRVRLHFITILLLKTGKDPSKQL